MNKTSISCKPYFSKDVTTKKSVTSSQSKRFVRKRQNSSQSIKFGPSTPRNSRKNNNIKIKEKNTSGFIQSIQSSSYIKKKQLLEIMMQDNDNEVKAYQLVTPKKQKNQRQYNLTQTFRQQYDRIQQKKIQFVSKNDFENQIDVKNTENMILLDQNDRLKRKINKFERLQLDEQKSREQCKKLQLKLRNSQYIRQQISRQNKALSIKFNEVQIELKQLKGKYQQIVKNYDDVVLQNQDLIRYFDQYMQENIPKQFKYLHSHRQMALQKKLQELKEIIKKSISERQSQLQAEIQILKNSYSSQLQKNRSLQIFTRIMKKKLQETEDMFIQNIKLRDQMNKVKIKYKDLKSQNQLLRSANEAIRKNLQLKISTKMMRNGYKIKTSNSDDSLNLSNLSN